MHHARSDLVHFTAAYDSLDEMTTRIAGTDTATYTTDPLGQFAAVRNVESVDTVTYDPAGRMTSEITVRKGVRYVRASTYNIRGQRTGVAFTSQPWGTSVSTGYRYDALERLDSLVDMTGGATVIAYDSLDRPISTTLPNGDQIGTPFANLMRPTDLTYSRSAVNSAIGASYAYGPRGELTDRIAPSSTAGRQFDTDSAGQLVGFENYTMTSGVCKYQQMPPDPPERVCTGPGKSYAGASATYSWDKVGNPTYNGAVTDPGNRLRQFGSDSLAYDADGNLIGRYQNHALVESFVWDALGQLTSVTLGSTTLSFGYDGFGRRVRKKVSVNGVLHTTNYFHDGDNLWVIAIADGKQLVSVTTSYPGIDQPHSIYQNGAISYYLQDVSGNITGLVNNAGTLQNHYSYLPFGGADTTVEAVTNTLKFAARTYDSEVGLYYMRARYYDPGLGRFISEDPIGLRGGINLYAYVRNGPIDDRDPSGLCGNIPGPCPFGDPESLWRVGSQWLGGVVQKIGDWEAHLALVGSGHVLGATIGGQLTGTGDASAGTAWESRTDLSAGVGAGVGYVIDPTLQGTPFSVNTGGSADGWGLGMSNNFVVAKGNPVYNGFTITGSKDWGWGENFITATVPLGWTVTPTQGGFQIETTGGGSYSCKVKGTKATCTKKKNSK